MISFEDPISDSCIVWRQEIPLADLQRLFCEELPDIAWVRLRALETLLRRMAAQLQRLQRHMPGVDFVPVVSRDMRWMAIARVARAQAEMFPEASLRPDCAHAAVAEGGREIVEDHDQDTDGDATDRGPGGVRDLPGAALPAPVASQVAIRRAVGLAEKVLARYAEDPGLCAEEALSILSGSPEKTLSREVLGLSGQPFGRVHSDAITVDVRLMPRLPAALLTRASIRVRIDNFGSVAFQEARGTVSRLHDPSDDSRDLDRLFEPRGHIAVIFAECDNPVLCRIAATANVPIEATVRLGVSIIEDRLYSATIEHLINIDGLISRIEMRLKQLALPLESQRAVTFPVQVDNE